MSRDYRAPTCFTACFSKAFPKGEYANLVCSVICLWGVCRTTVGEMCKYLHILTQVRQRKGNHFTFFFWNLVTWPSGISHGSIFGYFFTETAKNMLLSVTVWQLRFLKYNHSKEETFCFPTRGQSSFYDK